MTDGSPSDPTAVTRRLLLMHGGPFFELQRRAGLITDEDFRTPIRGAIVIALTFLLPSIVAALSSADNLDAFLSDPGVWAKFLFAPLLFLMAEPKIDRSIDRCIETFASIPLISKEGLPSFKKGLREAVSRRDSATAELSCVILAVLVTTINIWALSISASGIHWATDGGSLTPAGWVCLIVGNTLFWFLLFRLVWRHLVWAMLAHELAKTDLRLVVSHPDGHAGLSFMLLYSGGYTFFSLGVSCVVAAGLARMLHTGSLTLTAFTAICTIWLAVVAVFFALPLVRAVAQIMHLKAETIALTLGPIQEVERAAERKTLGRNTFANQSVSEDTVPADAKALYQAAIKCSWMLLNKSNVVSILAGALLPIAAVGLTVFPYADLGPVLKKLLFL